LLVTLTVTWAGPVVPGAFHFAVFSCGFSMVPRVHVHSDSRGSPWGSLVWMESMISSLIFTSARCVGLDSGFGLRILGGCTLPMVMVQVWEAVPPFPSATVTFTVALPAVLGAVHFLAVLVFPASSVPLLASHK